MALVAPCFVSTIIVRIVRAGIESLRLVGIGSLFVRRMILAAVVVGFFKVGGY